MSPISPPELNTLKSMQYVSKAPANTSVPMLPITTDIPPAINNIVNPQGFLAFLQDSLPWAAALLEAFGKQNIWANIASSLGILWKSGSSFMSQGLGAASLDWVKYGIFAGLGGTYGISKLKQSLSKFPIFNKGWAQVLIGLIGVVGLNKLSDLFDKHIKNKILGLFHKN